MSRHSVVSSSIYHQRDFDGRKTIRFNLRAVRELLFDEKIKDFNLTKSQREKMQRRVDLYVSFGGKLEFSGGMPARPQRAIPGKAIPGKPYRIVRGKKVSATPRQVIPPRIEPATAEILPSIQNLPNIEALRKALAVDLKPKKSKA